MLYEENGEELSDIIKQAKLNLIDGAPTDFIIIEIQERLSEFCERQTDHFNKQKFNMDCQIESEEWKWMR